MALLKDIGNWMVDFGTKLLEEVFINSWMDPLRETVPDAIGYAYMFCGGYVMLKALVGAGNILRPIAITSGFAVVWMAILS